MQTRASLTALCSTRGGDHAGSWRTRLSRAVSRWSPFVFPWSSLQSMTGVVVSRVGVVLAHGRLDGRRFRVEEVVQRPGPDVAGCLDDLGTRYPGPACASLPRNRTLVRYFRVPADSETEIKAMLPHLLAAELPLGVENFSWVWSSWPTSEEGYSVVTVYVSRNDQLEAYLAPLAEAGLNVVNLVPEGWTWARVLDLDGGAGEAAVEPVDQSFVIHLEGAPYLIVARGGQLLFDTILPVMTAADADGVARDGPALEEASRRFTELFDAPLPPPHHCAASAGGALDGGRVEHRFAAAVAAGGLAGGGALLPPSAQRRCRRRTMRDAAAGLARLGLTVALIWLALASWELDQSRRYLAVMEGELATQAATVAVLENEYAAIRDSSRERVAGTRILRVLDSLQSHVRPPIFLENLDYVQGQGVTLRGGAPANDSVLEMMERLASDPLWRGLRVMQLRSERIDGADRIHFVVEGRLN